MNYRTTVKQIPVQNTPLKTFFHLLKKKDQLKYRVFFTNFGKSFTCLWIKKRHIQKYAILVILITIKHKLEGLLSKEESQNYTMQLL